MNTPAHILISVAGLTRGSDPDSKTSNQPSYFWPAALGAVLPDAPMFAFYAIEKFIVGSSEKEIWTTRYFLPTWQDFFDVFNSVPICLIGLLLAMAFRRNWWAILFASMLLHIACDLPLHHDDGHRHFWPITDWRFESPVSYWDPSHHGILAAAGEFTLAAVCFLIAFRRHRRKAARWVLAILTTLYTLMTAGYFAYVLSR